MKRKLIGGMTLAGLVTSALLMFGNQSIRAASPDNQISKLVGEHMVHVLEAPDHVEVFDLDPLSKDLSYGLSGFPIVKKIDQLDEEIWSEISALVLDDKSHVFEIQKKCRFRPNIGFRYYRNRDSVNVLLSMQCKQWMFDSGKKQVYEDFDPVVEQIDALVRRARALSN